MAPTGVARFVIGSRATGAIIVGLGLLAEVGLRMTGPLPSLTTDRAPFEPSERPSVVATGPDVPDCVDPPGEVTGPPPTAWMAEYGGAEPGLRLLVAGDSVVLGADVRPEQTFAWQLGKRVADHTGRSVTLVNAGLNAAGYCGVIRAVHQHIDAEPPDLVIASLFADDLEQQAVVLVNGVLRADPEQMPPGFIQALVSTSYAFNWMWFQTVSIAVEMQTEQGGHPAPWVERGPRFVPKETQANVSRSVKRLDTRVQPIWTLLPPTGMPRCSMDAAPVSECGWLAHDLTLMDQLVGPRVGDFVDLRSVWMGVPSMELLSEIDDWNATGRLPVHPDPVGHALIAEALWPAVLKRLSPDEPSVVP